MKTSQNGIDLIKRFESCRLEAYKPIPSERYWTIGWGHYGSDVKEGSAITQKEADELLSFDLRVYEYAVNHLVMDDVNQNQFDALVSFAYNCGREALRTSTLLEKVNHGDMKSASNEFDKWIHGGGKVLNGLVSRRKAEKELFLTPVTSNGIIGVVKVTASGLHIRSGAGLQFPVIGKASKGKIYNVTANVNDWHRIILGDDDFREAWVFGNNGNYLELIR